MPTLSIIIPVYNVQLEYFRSCIGSIQAQSFQNYEIILVDDESADGGKLCDEYAASNQRFRVIHQKHGGVSAARNTGLRAATGEWVMFLDADDWWDPDLLSCMMAVAKPSLDMLCFDFCTFETTPIPRPGVKSTQKQFQLLGDKEITLLQNGLLDENHRRFHFFSGAVWSSIVRLDVIRRNNLYFNEQLTLCEDAVWSMNLLECVHKIGYLDRQFYHYRILPTSACHRFDPNLKAQLEKVNQQFKEFGKNHAKGIAYGDAYDLWLMKMYLRILRFDWFHPQNPKSDNEKKKEWTSFLIHYPSFQELEKVRFHKLYRARKIYIPFYFFRFNVSSYFLTKTLYLWLDKHNKL